MGWGELTLLWLCLINDVAADHQGQGAARVPWRHEVHPRMAGCLTSRIRHGVDNLICYCIF